MEKTTVIRALPQRIRAWLHQRCISEDVITAAQLGWTGNALAIPIADQQGQFAFFKFRRDPYAQDFSLPKYWSQPGSRAALYGWKELADRSAVVICEGELDRLCLESHGIAAMTSTGGAGVFKQEWCNAFREIPEVYVCFDNDMAGQKGIRRVAQLIPRIKVVDLPQEVGQGGDVTDFFARLGKRREDFVDLMDKARPMAQECKTASPRIDTAASHIKNYISITQIIGQYITLRQSGSKYIGCCIFHEDRVPSLIVYPETQSFYCFGCGIGGDVIRFLMEAEHITFREAVAVIRRQSGGFL